VTFRRSPSDATRANTHTARILDRPPMRRLVALARAQGMACWEPDQGPRAGRLSDESPQQVDGRGRPITDRRARG
jgi:hypothetical protein